MNALRNKVQLIGYVGQDPEIVNLETGKKIAKFSIATHEIYKNEKDQWLDDTNWHRIIAWNSTAAAIEENVKKGNEVQISGKLNNRSYETKDGSKRYITEIVCNEFFLIEKSAAPVS